jgi:glycine/D-amino acid oxidase-like deaminating enzyme
MPKLPIADHRTTDDLPSSANYIIFGLGVTGATISYKVLQEERSASIVMIEARQAASGASS